MSIKVSGEQPLHNPLPCAGQEPDIDRAEAQRFLEFLAGAPDMVFQFRVIDDKKRRPARNMRGTLAELYDRLATFNATGFGVFVVVNETDGPADAHVIAIRSSFVDLDGARERDSLVLRDERLNYFNKTAPASLTVESSPGRFHVYWFTWQMPMDRFTPVQKELAAILGGDPSVCNLSRIMRVPGFLHQKSSTPFLSRICYVAESVGRRRRADYVSLETLDLAIEKTRKKFALKPNKSDARPLPDLFDPAPQFDLDDFEGILGCVAAAEPGNRNSILFWAGCRFAEQRAPETAFNRLTEAAAYCGLPHAEIATTVASARRKVSGATV